MKAAKGFILGAIVLSAFQSASAAEWLMKATHATTPAELRNELQAAGHDVTQIESLGFNNWFMVRTSEKGLGTMDVKSLKGRAAWVEPNGQLHAYDMQPQAGVTYTKAADPEYVRQAARPVGADPMQAQQWALNDIGFNTVSHFKGSPSVVVAVVDTGVDYNHPDLNAAIWGNPGESGAKAHNGIDDDRNGYVDDYMGWDFVENDNKPYDKTGGPFGGNPGHGTHCAGVIGAVNDNSYGITGIAAGVKIMPLRFLSEKGQGTTANAVKAILYAVNNGAAVISNSWGGADEGGAVSKALREAFALASQRGRLLVVAAGNSKTNVDASPLSATPASFNVPTQITVAATGKGGTLASFSNYGASLVHIGAPGVGILSTVPNGKFMNMDGTSMATPVVAGAAALFWSQRKDLNAAAVKSAMLGTAYPTLALKGKTTTGGRLNLETLIRQYSFYR